MDRLSALTMLGAAALLAACEGEGSRAGASAPGRVVSVAATEEDPAAQFCDAAPAADAAPAFVWPSLTGAPPAPGGGARWVNVWATWCAPCVEEMPRLLEWRERLGREDVELELVFVSADSSDEAVAAFRTAHPEVPAGPRVADPTSLARWSTLVGLGEGSGLPIHLLVDARGRVRCARTGGVQERDFASVRRLIASL